MGDTLRPGLMAGEIPEQEYGSIADDTVRGGKNSQSPLCVASQKIHHDGNPGDSPLQAAMNSWIIVTIKQINPSTIHAAKT